jgi:hypothetical protein
MVEHRQLHAMMPAPRSAARVCTHACHTHLAGSSAMAQATGSSGCCAAGGTGPYDVWLTRAPDDAACQQQAREEVSSEWRGCCGGMPRLVAQLNCSAEADGVYHPHQEQTSRHGRVLHTRARSQALSMCNAGVWSLWCAPPTSSSHAAMSAEGEGAGESYV